MKQNSQGESTVLSRKDVEIVYTDSSLYQPEG